MIEIGDLERDALIEMFNIGVGRAAASLSAVVGDQVVLSAPSILLMHPNEVSAALFSGQLERLSTVSQDFSGPFDARAILLFPEEKALRIVGYMLGSHLPPQELSDFAQEAMCELGNIILNACISAMADLFEVSFEGTLPEHRVSRTEDIALVNGGTDEHVVLVLKVNMILSRDSIQGNLLYLLSVNSMQALVACIGTYLVKQGLR